MNLFTTTPAAWHWPLWALLLVVLALGLRAVIGFTREYRELRQFEEMQREQRRLIPPEPSRFHKDKDELAARWREDARL